MFTPTFTQAYTHGMLRVSDETRERVQRVARDDFGGVTADEAVRRLLDEHWETAALAAMERYRAENPQGWNDYLADSDELATADAPINDTWDRP